MSRIYVTGGNGDISEWKPTASLAPTAIRLAERALINTQEAMVRKLIAPKCRNGTAFAITPHGFCASLTDGPIAETVAKHNVRLGQQVKILIKRGDHLVEMCTFAPEA